MITDSELHDRIESGERYMAAFAKRSEAAIARYKNSSGRVGVRSRTPGAGEDQTLGEVNYAAINIRQKVAATALYSPDFKVSAGAPDEETLIRRYLRDRWHQDNRVRLLRRVLLSRMVTGMGFAAYLWDTADKFVLEYVQIKDLLADPHTYDESWDNPRWMGRRVRVPPMEAEERWGEQAVSNWRQQNVSGDDKASAVEAIIYWDGENEVELLGNRIVSARPNPYGRVPILVLQGDPHPVSEFGEGDYDQCLGAVEMYHRLQAILNKSALHGGGMPWARTDFISESARQAVVDGTHLGVIPVEGVPGEQVLGYTSVMPLNAAVLEAIRFVGAGLDADQGVPQYARGVTLRDPKFATQVAMETSSSGARGTLSRTEFERYCERVVRAEVDLHVQFGITGPEPPSEQEIAVWMAMSGVTDIRVIEESGSWRDPSVEQQAALQMLTTVAQTMPLFLQLAQMGVVTKLPDISAYLTDVLRAFRRTETAGYWTQLAPAPAAAAQPGIPAEETPQEEIVG